MNCWFPGDQGRGRCKRPRDQELQSEITMLINDAIFLSDKRRNEPGLRLKGPGQC